MDLRIFKFTRGRPALTRSWRTGRAGRSKPWDRSEAQPVAASSIPNMSSPSKAN